MLKITLHYRYEDYGKIFFDTFDETTEAANKIPRTNQVIYLKIGNRYYKRTVESIRRIKGIEDNLYLYINKRNWNKTIYRET